MSKADREVGVVGTSLLGVGDSGFDSGAGQIRHSVSLSQRHFFGAVLPTH